MSNDYAPTKVKLVGSTDNREQAWRFSRPTFNLGEELDMDSLGSMDISLNSLASYTFEIESSQKFRDMIFCIRPSQIWARSIRSAPMTLENLKVSKCCYPSPESVTAIQDSMDAIESGLSQDKSRLMLPEQLSVGYTISLDRRTVLDLIYTLETYSDNLMKFYGHPMLEASGLGSDYSRSKKRETLNDISSRYRITKFEEGKTDTLCDMVMINSTMTSVLMSHFIRQGAASVRTDLWNDLVWGGFDSSGGQPYPYTSQSTLHEVVSYQPKESYDRLMKVRSHWFCDWNEWGYMVAARYIGLSPVQILKLLPQTDSDGLYSKEGDPYHEDMLSRIRLEELNYPEPFMTESPEFINIRYKVDGSNPVIEIYRDLQKRNRTMITSNPSNPYRVEYIKNLAMEYCDTEVERSRKVRIDLIMSEITKYGGVLWREIQTAISEIKLGGKDDK